MAAAGGGMRNKTHGAAREVPDEDLEEARPPLLFHEQTGGDLR